MTWVLVAAGLLALGVFATFGWALCVAAADADRIVVAARDAEDNWADDFMSDPAAASGTYVKRPRASDVAEGMTEER